MAEIVEEFGEFWNNKESKNPKVSIRLKYNRRRAFLRHSLEQFIMFSEMLLDEKKYGKRYKRRDAELLLEKSKELLKILPEEKEIDFTLVDQERFLRAIEDAETETKRILEKMPLEVEQLTEELIQVQNRIKEIKDSSINI